MSDVLADYLRGRPGDRPAGFFLPGYLQAYNPATGANTVQVTGTQTFTNLAVLGPLADLAIGRVLLLTTPGAPVILGNITKPTI